MHKEILRLAVPNVLTNLTIPLVSLVDVALMGRMPSTRYIVAIGLGTLVFNFIYWAFGFLRMGTTGMVSQSFGKNDQASQQILLKRGLLIAILSGLGMLLLQIPIERLSIQILNAEEAVNPLLSEYIFLRIWAAPATIAVYVFTGWFLGMQDSKSALILALVVNGTNAIMSWLLVYQFNMEIKGVALGTVIAQYAGLIAASILLLRKYRISLLQLIKDNLSSSDPDMAWKNFILVNSDILVRTLCLIFTLSFFKAKAANIDPILGAANILLMEFITISAYGIDGFAFAAESICGKYFGQKNVPMLNKSVKYSFVWGVIIAIVLALIFFLFGRNILGLLTDKTSVIDAAMPFVPWLILAPLVNTFAFIWDGIYIGTTTSSSMRNTMLISTVIVFLPAYYFFFPIYENHGLWLSLTLFMFSRGVLLSILYPKKVLARIN